MTTDDYEDDDDEDEAPAAAGKQPLSAAVSKLAEKASGVAGVSAN